MSEKVFTNNYIQEDTTNSTFLKDQIENSSSPNEPNSNDLEYSWVFWYTGKISIGASDEDYEKAMEVLGEFSTIQGFWKYWKYLENPSKLSDGTKLHVFKRGIKPMWEDEANKNGGKWILTSSKSKTDYYWSQIVLSLIGEQFQHSDDMCGVILTIKNGGDKFNIWNRSGDNQEIIESVTQYLKNLTGCNFVDYQQHKQSVELHQKLKSPLTSPAFRDRKALSSSNGAYYTNSPDFSRKANYSSRDAKRTSSVDFGPKKFDSSSSPKISQRNHERRNSETNGNPISHSKNLRSVKPEKPSVTAQSNQARRVASVPNFQNENNSHQSNLPQKEVLPKKIENAWAKPLIPIEVGIVLSPSPIQAEEINSPVQFEKTNQSDEIEETSSTVQVEDTKPNQPIILARRMGRVPSFQSSNSKRIKNSSLSHISSEEEYSSISRGNEEKNETTSEELEQMNTETESQEPVEEEITEKEKLAKDQIKENEFIKSQESEQLEKKEITEKEKSQVIKQQEEFEKVEKKEIKNEEQLTTSQTTENKTLETVNSKKFQNDKKEKKRKEQTSSNPKITEDKNEESHTGSGRSRRQRSYGKGTNLSTRTTSKTQLNPRTTKSESDDSFIKSSWPWILTFFITLFFLYYASISK